MGFMDIIKDIVLPVAGGAAGYYLGGPVGAGIGAGGGRYLGGELKDEESSSQLKNSLLAGAFGYGADRLSGLIPGNNWSGNFSSMGSGASAMGPSATGGGGFMSNLKGGNSLIPIMMGAGILSEAGSGQKRQEEEYQKQLASALEGATWNDATRAKYMSSLRGSLNDSLAAQNKRTAAVGAEAGRGGGFFSNKTARTQADINEAVAKSLGTTYEPYSTAVAQLKAQAGVSPQTTLERLLGGVGDVAGKWPYLALMNAYGGKG